MTGWISTANNFLKKIKSGSGDISRASKFLTLKTSREVASSDYQVSLEKQEYTSRQNADCDNALVINLELYEVKINRLKKCKELLDTMLGDRGDVARFPYANHCRHSDCVTDNTFEMIWNTGNNSSDRSGIVIIANDKNLFMVKCYAKYQGEYEMQTDSRCETKWMDEETVFQYCLPHWLTEVLDLVKENIDNHIAERK